MSTRCIEWFANEYEHLIWISSTCPSLQVLVQLAHPFKKSPTMRRGTLSVEGTSEMSKAAGIHDLPSAKITLWYIHVLPYNPVPCKPLPYNVFKATTQTQVLTMIWCHQKFANNTVQEKTVG